MIRRFSLSPGAILVLSSVYFFGGMKSLAAVLLAAAVHEAGHAAAICALGGRVRRLRFDSSGLCMYCAGAYSALGEVLVLLAGPAAGLALAYICALLGSAASNGLLLNTAGMSLALTAYNMLPALPLDGGRALLCALSRLTGRKKAESILYFTGVTAALALACAGIALRETQLGMALFISAVWLLIAQTGIVKSVSML